MELYGLLKCPMQVIIKMYEEHGEKKIIYVTEALKKRIVNKKFSHPIIQLNIILLIFEKRFLRKFLKVA